MIIYCKWFNLYLIITLRLFFIILILSTFAIIGNCQIPNINEKKQADNQCQPAIIIYFPPPSGGGGGGGGGSSPPVVFSNAFLSSNSISLWTSWCFFTNFFIIINCFNSAYSFFTVFRLTLFKGPFILLITKTQKSKVCFWHYF